MDFALQKNSVKMHDKIFHIQGVGEAKRSRVKGEDWLMNRVKAASILNAHLLTDI